MMRLLNWNPNKLESKWAGMRIGWNENKECESK